MQGGRRTTRTITWTGGTERAMVVDGYTWTYLPDTDYEVRALTVQPLALRYRPRGWPNRAAGRVGTSAPVRSTGALRLLDRRSNQGISIALCLSRNELSSSLSACLAS